MFDGSLNHRFNAIRLEMWKKSTLFYGTLVQCYNKNAMHLRASKYKKAEIMTSLLQNKLHFAEKC